MSWVAVGVGAAGVIAGGVSAATAQGPTTYGPEDLTRKNVNAFSIYGPGILGLNREYNPKYAEIGSRVTSDMLFGTPDRVEKMNVPLWDSKGNYIGYKKKFKVPGSEGLISTYQRAGEQMAGFNRQQTMADLNAFVPASVEAARMANPLLGDIATRAKEGLAQGGALDPSTIRTLTQASLGNASLRGFGHSPLDAYQAYSNIGMEAEARKRQREQFAMQASSIMPDPFALMGRPAMGTTLGTSLGMGASALGRQASSPAINPFAFSGITSVPQDNTTSNVLGAVSGGLMNMAGGFAGMGGGQQRPPNSGQNPGASGFSLYNAQF